VFFVQGEKKKKIVQGSLNSSNSRFFCVSYAAGRVNFFLTKKRYANGDNLRELGNGDNPRSGITPEKRNGKRNKKFKVQ
jgi:hypothetical protein